MTSGRPVTARAIAEWIGGRVIGDETTELHGVATLREATPSDLSYLAGTAYVTAFRRSSAGAVVMAPTFAEESDGPPTRIVVDDPIPALAVVLNRLYPPAARMAGIHPTAVISAHATVGADVEIGPYATVDDGTTIGARVRIGTGVAIGRHVTIGDDTQLMPRVCIYDGSVIGEGVLLHAGVVIGADGFGFEPSASGPVKVPHVGRVVIGDRVEIGANSTVDRGTLGDTTIGADTKIDNLVQIGHNSRIGRRCLIAGAAALGGSSVLEDDVILGGQAGIAGHLTIGAGARVGAQAGVLKSLAAGGDYTGTPTRPLKDYQRVMATMYRLSRVAKVLEELAEERLSGGR